MKRLCTLLLALQAIYSYAQPAKTTLQGKEFYVYPLRSNENEIPPYFVPIPDGNYIMYREYTFKKARFKKEMKLQDTTVVRAIFSIKNNVPWGKASFYAYNKITEKKGEYVNGLPEGVWEEYEQHVYKKEKWTTTERYTYKTGLKEGEYTELSNDKITAKGQYKKNKPTGTWYNMNTDGEIWHQFTYADSVSWVRGMYDMMYPGSGTRQHYHGTEIEKMNNRVEKVEHRYGQVVFFDTLYYWSGNPEYILTKKETNKPDSTALFVLTNYRVNGQIKMIREYRNGYVVSTRYFRDDKEGKEYETYYSEDFYSQLKKGDLYLKRVYYSALETRYEYALDGFLKTFDRNISINGDTTKDFKVYDIDTVRLSYSFERSDYEPVTKIEFVRFGHLFVDTAQNLNIYNRTYEVNDSSLVFYNHAPFTGIIKGLSHKRKSKHRMEKEKSGWVVYANKRYYRDFPYAYTEYSELRNGKPDGKIISKNRSSVTVRHMKNGQPHGTDITTVYKWKLNKEMREIARKNGITKKRVTYVSQRFEYNNGERTGHWETRNAAGVVVDSRNFLNDQLHGERIEKFYNGNVREIATYNNGQLHGKQQRWDITGTLLREGEYENDLLNGYLKLYKSTGEPDFTIYAQHNILEGPAILYNEIGLMEWKLEFNANDSVPFFYMDASDYNSYRERFTWDNDNLVKVLQNRLKPYPATFMYTEYFYTGKVAAEGVFKNGRMSGIWNFYDLDGNKIHEVDFKTEELNLPHDTLFVMGKITSYYSNGKIKSTGYLENFDRNYDCKSKKNVYDFSIIFENYWETNGKQTLVNGNGLVTQYDEHGQREASGEYFEYQQNGFWKWWDKDAKLSTAGHFEQGSREGTWWYGDLEGLSFIDNACFDTSSDEVLKEISQMKKNLYIRQSIFVNDVEISTHEFDMNMNKERMYKKYQAIGHVDF